MGGEVITSEVVRAVQRKMALRIYQDHPELIEIAEKLSLGDRIPRGIPAVSRVYGEAYREVGVNLNDTMDLEYAIFGYSEAMD